MSAEINANCFDSAVHSHDGGKTLCQYGSRFTIRHNLVWARPRLTTYRAADRRRARVGLNRYPGCVIGVFAQVGHRVVGLTWGRPGAPIRVPLTATEIAEETTR